jgi:hypothetical protein
MRLILHKLSGVCVCASNRKIGFSTKILRSKHCLFLLFLMFFSKNFKLSKIWKILTPELNKWEAAVSNRFLSKPWLTANATRIWLDMLYIYFLVNELCNYGQNYLTSLVGLMVIFVSWFKRLACPEITTVD